VSIRHDLPDTLIVQVTERPSVGYIVTSDGYVQVDAEGRMLAIQQSLSNYRLPVISGVGINELPELGGIIQNKKLRQALDILQSCDVTLLDNIAELNVGQEYYILLYTNQQLEVRLGGLENMEQRLKDLNKILTEVVGTKIASDRILYIDMRYENSSAIIKLRD
jgi:cell division protein FtsQ